MQQKVEAGPFRRIQFSKLVKLSENNHLGESSGSHGNTLDLGLFGKCDVCDWTKQAGSKNSPSRAPPKAQNSELFKRFPASKEFFQLKNTKKTVGDVFF